MAPSAPPRNAGREPARLSATGRDQGGAAEAASLPIAAMALPDIMRTETPLSSTGY